VNTHRYLSSNFSKTTRKFTEEEIILTPFFNIGKDVPEVLNQYRKLPHQPTKYDFTKYLFQFLCRLIVSLCKPVLHHLYNLKAFRAYKSQIPNSANKIFVSHYTSDSTKFNEPDPYFGGLISQNRNERSTSLVLLINHSTKLLETSEKSGVFDNTLYLILPKTADSRSAVHIYIKQLKFFWRILLKGMEKVEISSSERLLLFELAIQQLSQSALSQQYLFLNASRALLKSKAQEFYITFEGHSFETYLARKLRKLSKTLIININQFAPVVPSQYSFYQNLELIPVDVNINVTGRSMIKQILKLTNVSSQRIKIIGSSKHKKDIKLEKTAKPKNLTVLFAPEGFLNSFAEFALMAEFCASTLKDFNFIIRAHPASKKYETRITQEYLSKNTNLILSSSSLEEDLSKSDICIYRSSAVGVEGMQYGLIPIHFSTKLDGSVDPIRLEDLKHPRVNNKDMLINALEEYRKMSAKDFSKIRAQVIEIYSEYFNEILI
jgi:hypothetical protein